MILQPGPESELAVVREIFRQFVFEQKSESLIAHELNQEGILNRRGTPGPISRSDMFSTTKTTWA